MIPTISSARTRQWLLVTLAAIAFTVCYAQVILALVDQWATNPLFSYGFAVPLISAYLIWNKADDLRRLPRTPDYWLGVPLTLASAAMLLAGHAGAVVMLQGLSLIATLAGLILLLYGRPTLRAVWFPICYLLLMLPVWDYPINRLQAPSQDLSARLAVTFLRAIGIPAMRTGMVITVPTHALEVMRECSGVSQLIALIAMVLPAAYLWLGTLPRRIALVVFAVVVGYLSNGVRIALIGWLVVKGWSDGDSTSPFHVIQGLVVSGLAYLVIGAFLSFLSKTRPGDGAQTAASVPVADPGFTWVPRRHWLDAVVVLVLIYAGIAQNTSSRADVVLRGDLSALPNQINEWTMDPIGDGTGRRFQGIADDLVGAYPSPAGERRFAAVDDELMRAYRTPSGDRVQVYIGYYRHQQQGKELAGEVSHSLQAVASPVSITLGEKTLELREVVQPSDAQKGVVFWYDVNGRIVPNIYVAKGYTIWDALTRRRTNGAVVMIAWESRGGEGSERARQDAIGFAQALVPVLRQHLPS